MGIIVSIIGIAIVLALDRFVAWIIRQNQFDYESERAETWWNVICALVSCVVVYATLEDSMIRILFLVVIGFIYYKMPKLYGVKMAHRSRRRSKSVASRRAAKGKTSVMAKHLKVPASVQYQKSRPKELGRVPKAKEKKLRYKKVAQHFVNGRSGHR